MTSSQSLALWADKLRDISASGLRFAKNIYDRENYQVVQDVALKMLALATGESLEQMEALRAPIFSRPTPLSVGDAAVINEAGQILLIQRADNKKWAMPGGAMEVGETPSEGVVREALEETGVHSEAVALVGLYDSRLRGTISRHHLYQVVFLCEPFNSHDGKVEGTASHAIEALDTGWFTQDALPEPLDPGHVRPIGDAFRVWAGQKKAYFD